MKRKKDWKQILAESYDVPNDKKKRMLTERQLKRIWDADKKS